MRTKSQRQRNRLFDSSTSYSSSPQQTNDYIFSFSKESLYLWTYFRRYILIDYTLLKSIYNIYSLTIGVSNSDKSLVWFKFDHRFGRDFSSIKPIKRLIVRYVCLRRTITDTKYVKTSISHNQGIGSLNTDYADDNHFKRHCIFWRKNSGILSTNNKLVNY